MHPNVVNVLSCVAMGIAVLVLGGCAFLDDAPVFPTSANISFAPPQVPSNSSETLLILLPSGLSGSFSIRVHPAGNSSLFTGVLQFSSAAGMYGAVGFSNKGMEGRVVACSEEGTTPVCILYNTVNYAVMPVVAAGLSANASALFRVLWSRLSGARRTVAFEIDAQHLGACEGTQRGIFGYGTVDRPAMVALTQRVVTSLDTVIQLSLSDPPVIVKPLDRVGRHILLSSSGTMLLSDAAPSDMLLSWAAVVIALVVMGTVGHVYIRLSGPLAGTSPRSHRILEAGAVLLLLVGIPTAILTMAHHHYTNREAAAPWFRAVGEVAKYGFALAFFPVCRRVSLPAVVFRSPRQHSLRMHTYVGVLIVAAVSIHGAGMAFKTRHNFFELFNPYSPRRNLFGVLGWVFLMVVAVPALLRHMPLQAHVAGRVLPGMFAIFSATHWMVGVVVVCALLHHGELVWLILPGVLSYAMDRAWMAYNSNCANAGAHVLQSSYSSCAGVIALQISCPGVGCSSDTEGPASVSGKHLLVTIPEVGFYSHPFSIAFVDGAATTVFIQNTSGGGDPRSTSTRWTERLSYRLQSRPHDPPAVKVTTLVSEPSFVPLTAVVSQNSDHIEIVFVAGGIGITPILSYLHSLLQTSYQQTPDEGIYKTFSLLVVWAVRSEGQRAYFTPLLQRLVGGIGTLRSPGGDRELYSASLHVFSTASSSRSGGHGWGWNDDVELSEMGSITSDRGRNLCALSFAPEEVRCAGSSVYTIHSGRPTVASVQGLVDDGTAAPTTHLRGVVYGCGPLGLLAVVERVAENRHLKCSTQRFH